MASLTRIGVVCRIGAKPLLLSNTLLPRGLVAYQKSRDVEPFRLAVPQIQAAQSHTATSGSKAASMHWTSERVLSVLLLGMAPAAYLYPGPVLDYTVAAALTLHGHWGIGQVLTDYVHGKTKIRLAKAGLFTLSMVTFAGLCYFNYNDVGVCKAIAMLWRV
ncbi:succinate dehydrogenase [ubiquinone] cytochrome b small subunit A, mitochondrial [Chanos chanos]|uniref:Succinate dehydrogenase [ubiquinone] cytochrome b small subunit n=1 Tax=Chanos chanos TaxID=29144 RepID=A0A6J2WWX9_CHACN|nr:succinate dehydrogenase [ubiquinone] cytochrome b small subunit B, mitochondrial-like [Chanos chanos]